MLCLLPEDSYTGNYQTSKCLAYENTDFYLLNQVFFFFLSCAGYDILLLFRIFLWVLEVQFLGNFIYACPSDKSGCAELTTGCLDASLPVRPQPRRQYWSQDSTVPQRKTDLWRISNNVPLCYHYGRPGHDRIRRKYYWPGLYGNTLWYVPHCPECQRRKSLPQLPSG